jgi:4'-phosphopantetheinyl transferase
MAAHLAASAPPLILGEDAHVWGVALDDPGHDLDSFRARLSADEQARADRFKFPQDRRRYIISHAAVRDILSRYTLTNAADLEFISGAHGKPRLAPPFRSSEIEFNLSHSHERALLALNRRHDLGVDIEHVKGDFEIFEVARRFFTEPEVEQLRGLPERLQRQAFYQCWTSKEAFLKAKGTGLSGELDEVNISLHGSQVRIQACVAGWALQELSCSEDYKAALVTKDKPLNVFCHRWEAN